LRLKERRRIILSGALVTYFPKKSNDKKSDGGGFSLLSCVLQNLRRMVRENAYFCVCVV